MSSRIRIRRPAWATALLTVGVTGAALAVPVTASAVDWAWSMPATTLAGAQGLQDIGYTTSGVDGNGIVTMAWYEEATNGRDRIMAARYPAAGALAPLAAPVDLTASFGSDPIASYPIVAVSPNGDAVVAWTQPASAGGYRTVWASRYSASGGTWSNPTELVAPASAVSVGSQEPVVVAGPQGTFTVAWLGASQPNSTLAYVAARYDGGWGTPVAISPAYLQADWTMDSPGMAADGLGNVVVLWPAKKGGQSPEASKIFSARFTTGSGWSLAASPTVVFTGSDPNAFSVALKSPSVAANASGDFIAAWRNGESAVQIQAVRSQGMGWAAAQNVGSTGGRTDPSITLGADGTATVGWVAWGSNPRRVEFARSPGSAPGTWETPVMSAPTGGARPTGYSFQLGADSDGDLTAVWDATDTTTGQYLIEANHLAAGSSTWSAPTTLQAGAYQSNNWYDVVQYPTLAVAPSGVATAAWEDVVNETPDDNVHPAEYYIKGSRYAGSDPAPTPDPSPQPSGGGSSQGAGASTGGSSAQPSGSTQAEVTISEQAARAGLPVSAAGTVRLPLACPSGLPSNCDADGDLSMALPRALQAEGGRRAESAARVRVLARFRGVEIESGRTRLYSVRLAPRTYNALRRAGYRRVPATLRVSNRLATGAVTVSRQRVWLRILPMKVAVTG